MMQPQSFRGGRMVLLILTSHGKNTNMDLANWKVSMCFCVMSDASFSITATVLFSVHTDVKKKKKRKETGLIIYKQLMLLYYNASSTVDELSGKISLYYRRVLAWLGEDLFHCSTRTIHFTH